jgi:hypothetical protein
VNSKDQIIKSLKLFNEKVDKLSNSRFIRSIGLPGGGFKMSFKQNDAGVMEAKAERKGPDDEAISAAALTLRFFVQNNERISLRNISRYYADNLIDDSLTKRYEEIRNELNDFLDNERYSVFKSNQTRLTRRELLDTFLYGDLAHANEAKYDLIQSWKRSEMLFKRDENHLVQTMFFLYNYLEMIADLNKQTIIELQK